MVMALNYDRDTNTTCGCLGFQLGTSSSSPGQRMLLFLENLTKYALDPMLLPVLASGLWSDQLQEDNHYAAGNLRQIQADIGLMQPYLQGRERTYHKEGANPIDGSSRFESLHSKIVLQHGFLTNGMTEFAADLFPPIQEAFRSLKVRSDDEYIRAELKNYIRHIQMRAKSELQHRRRMLSRINIYLQVVRPSLYWIKKSFSFF